MNQINITFSKTKKKYITIYQEIKKLILNGTIKSDEKIPSKRDLASHLNVSINTIMNSYNLLLDEGYIYAKEKSGYFAASNRFIKSEESPVLKIDLKEKEYKYDFTSENIDSSLFPFYTFKKVTQNIMENNPSIWLKRNSFQGDRNLREQLSKYLFENKGMEVTSANIVIVSSLEESLNIVASLTNIENVALENPLYPKVAAFFSKKSNINYLSLDKEGLILPSSSNYDLVYVTPYNQYPSGVKMSMKRKHEIINSSSKYIFEDDFDCDLIDQNKIYSTLYSLNPNKVFYHGSFSHTLCPGLRISYLVLPLNIISKYYEIYKATSSKISSLDQSILASFLEEGHYYRHINKLRKAFKEKKEMIRIILQKNDIEYEEQALSFFIHYSIKKENKIKEALESNSIKINFMNRYSINKKDARIILCYTNISKDDLEKGLNLLIESIKK